MACSSICEPCVIDLNACNVGSVVNMLTRIGFRPKVIQSPADAIANSPVVFPGVGHFSHLSSALDKLGWREWFNRIHMENLPILGICLGAQLMCESSEEGPGDGLGWINSKVCRFPNIDTSGLKLRIPHMGWQNFTPPTSLLPFAVQAGRMYYAHSYYITPTAQQERSPYQSQYGGVRFAAAVRSRNAIGLQFHPEKSHRHGMALLRNWVLWAQGSCA